MRAVPCVEIAVLRGRVVIRDSKDLDWSLLGFAHQEWEAFVAGITPGELTAQWQRAMLSVDTFHTARLCFAAASGAAAGGGARTTEGPRWLRGPAAATRSGAGFLRRAYC
jgi:hypothetical protein